MNTLPIEDLAAPFAPDQVKQRRGNFGQTLSYLETSAVIARLNETLEGDWSFVVVKTLIKSDEVIVRGRLTIGDTVREQFGGSRITRHKDTGEILALADDLKAAASDALKKCATLAGIGLYLYGGGSNGNGSRAGGGRHDRRPDPPRNHQRSQRQRPASGNGRGRLAGDRITNDQIARIFEVAREADLPQKGVIALARESFGTTISQLTPAQAEDLIAMIGQAA